MKKYRVITDNLDWYDVKEGDILTLSDDGFCSIERPGAIGGKFISSLVLELHMGWFEEIQYKEYTRADMSSYGTFCYRAAISHEYAGKDLFKEWRKTI